MSRIRIRSSFLAAAALLALGTSQAAAAPHDRANPHPACCARAEATPSQGRLGVSVLPISEELRRHLGAPADRGVLVDTVRRGSPAERSGVESGDVIMEVTGMPVRSGGEILAALADWRRGDTVSLVVMRDQERLSLRATLVNDPARADSRWHRLDAEAPRLADWMRDMRSFRFDVATPERRLERALDRASRRLDALERRVDGLERSEAKGRADTRDADTRDADMHDADMHDEAARDAERPAARTDASM